MSEVNEAAMRAVIGRASALQTALDTTGVGRPKARRGTSNGNAAGSSEDRRRRKVWLVSTYQADMGLLYTEGSPDRWAPWSAKDVYGDDLQPACRCYRCGELLTVLTVTVDRIKPGCQGGTYARTNIRPACADCNEKTGGATRRVSKHQCPDCRREDPNDTRRPRPLVAWSGPARCATHTRKPLAADRAR